MAPRCNFRSVMAWAKYSASRSGTVSNVETTMNEVRRSANNRWTAWARSTNPSYMVWNKMKNSAMSARNWVPRIRSAT